MTEYQIQARLKGGQHWEPVSVESRDKNGERKYQYATADEATEALEAYRGKEVGSLRLLARPTGLFARYDLRIVPVVTELTAYTSGGGA